MADKLIKDADSSAIFDDWTEDNYDKEFDDDEHTTPYWTQVCELCAHKHHLIDSCLSSCSTGELTCGVQGCKNEADFYYDFDGEEIVK